MGYFHLAHALQNLENLEDALDAINQGLVLDPLNGDLIKLSLVIEDGLKRKNLVQTAIIQAKTQLL